MIERGMMKGARTSSAKRRSNQVRVEGGDESRG